jgi:hypothetical protein
VYRTSKGKAIVTSVAIACTVSWLAVGQKLEAKRLDGAHDSGGLPRPGPSLRERATAVGVTSERPEIPFISPHAAAVDVPSFDSAWGGPRTGSEPTLSDRVADYLIDATLDPKTHIIEGKEQLTWRNRSDREVSSVFLHLYLNAFEGPGSTFFTEAHRHQALR